MHGDAIATPNSSDNEKWSRNTLIVIIVDSYKMPSNIHIYSPEEPKYSIMLLFIHMLYFKKYFCI
jgi:hypothetical protein